MDSIEGRRKQEAFPVNNSENINFESKVFFDQVVDNNEYRSITFDKCGFLRIGGKELECNNVEFRDCDFYDCYFVRAKFNNCVFRNCKFIRVNFTMADLSDSSMEYSRFYDCFIVHQQARKLRNKNASAASRLLLNLANQCRAAGYWTQVAPLSLQSIKFQEKYYMSIINPPNAYYKEKFNLKDKAVYFARFLMSKTNYFLWGHGHKPIVLMFNLLFFTFIIFPLTLWWNDEVFSIAGKTTLAEIIDRYFTYVGVSIQTTLPFTSINQLVSSDLISKMPVWLEITGAFTGLVFFGLFISVLFRHVSRS